MIPVSQAFAARHIHDDARVKMMTSVSVLSGVIMESQYIVKTDEQDNLSDTAHSSSQLHKTHLQSRCGKRNGHKGDCGSCQCTPIVGAPISVQVASVFIPMDCYNVQPGCPLYSVVIAPPLRPPIS